MTVVARRPGIIPAPHGPQIRRLPSTSSRKKSRSAASCRPPNSQAPTIHQTAPVQLPDSESAPERAPARRQSRSTKARHKDAAAATPSSLGEPAARTPSSPPTKTSWTRWTRGGTALYSGRRSRSHRNSAAGATNPNPSYTIHTAMAQIRGPRPLPPPDRPVEGEGTDGLAGGE
jgi:hypothetical protein